MGEETAQLILKIANEMNYQPNLAAKSLRSGKTKTIGILLFTSEAMDFSELSQGTMTVSYTHLDVYKRQVFGYLLNHFGSLPQTGHRKEIGRDEKRKDSGIITRPEKMCIRDSHTTQSSKSNSRLSGNGLRTSSG